MDKYRKLIKKINKLQRRNVEKNIFSIGGRGHYENPISDVLAFFMDPTEEHGFGKLLLQSLCDCVVKDSPLLELVTPPTREAVTEYGNRIDLIMEGDDWVLVVENKIRHSAVNPFKDYERYVDQSYLEKRAIYVLLSVKKETPPVGWVNLTYDDFISHIKKNIGSYLIFATNNKWHVILREFILNIENESGAREMTVERIEFVKDNYFEIQEINDMLNEYISYIKNEGVCALNSVSLVEGNVVSVKQHNWGKEGIALRFISNQWSGDTNITLLLRKDGSYRVQLYVYNVKESEVSLLKSCVDHKKYKEFWTESKTIRCFGLFDSKDQDVIFDEIKNVAKNINGYFGCQSTS